MDLDLTLWFFLVVIALGAINLSFATVVLRRRARATRVAGPPRRISPRTIIEILALALILVVLMFVLLVSVQLSPSLQAIAGPVRYVVAALLVSVMRALVSRLPNARPEFMRALRVLEVVLFVLAVASIILGFIARVLL